MWQGAKDGRQGYNGSKSSDLKERKDFIEQRKKRKARKARRLRRPCPRQRMTTPLTGLHTCLRPPLGQLLEEFLANS